MHIEHSITTLVVLLLLAVLSNPLAKLFRLPYTSMLVLTGFVVSEIIVFAGYDTGLRAENYQALIFYVFIPLLVFESAFNINKQRLRENILPILFLAIAGMFLSCMLSAAVLFYGIDHEVGFPWIAALIAGAILASTDPVAVMAAMKVRRAPERLKVLLEGESLFNDGAAIVLFALFLSIALSGGETQPGYIAILDFFRVFIGGAAVGALLGYLAGKLSGFLQGDTFFSSLSLLLAYGSYLLAEWLTVSGIMATLLAGIVLSTTMVTDEADRATRAYLWQALSAVTNAMVFLIVGAVITISMFEQRWLAMLIAIVAILVSRVVAVYGGLSFLSLFMKQPVSLKHQTVLVWGGLRGAVTLALALSLPTSLDYWWTIQSIAFGVVVFALFVQAPSLQYLLSSLKIKSAD